MRFVLIPELPERLLTRDLACSVDQWAGRVLAQLLKKGQNFQVPVLLGEGVWLWLLACDCGNRRHHNHAFDGRFLKR